MTLSSILMFTYISGIRQFALENSLIVYAAIVVAFVTLFTLMCCQKVAYSWPSNYIVLFIFTGAISYSVGFITLIARPELVIENRSNYTKENRS